MTKTISMNVRSNSRRRLRIITMMAESRMGRFYRCTLVLFFGMFIALQSYGQQDSAASLTTVPADYLNKVEARAAKMERQIDKQSEKVLAVFARQEEKIKRKLAKADPAAAEKVFGDAQQQYDKLKDKLKTPDKLKRYIPSLDTFSSSLKFLEKYPAMLQQSKPGKEKLQAAMASVKGLENQFQRAEAVRSFLKERKQYLKDQLGKMNMQDELKKLNSSAYYYSEQMNQYREMLNDRKKAEEKAISILKSTKPFRDFMQKYSMLAEQFGIRPDASGTVQTLSLAGLQTRTQVNNLIQQQLAGGGPNAQAQISERLQDAQAKMNELKDKVSKLGESAADLDMPDDFKPNLQRTKTFLQRIEFGSNIQSVRSNGFLPVTTDLALTAGYKLNDKSTIGVGAAYKFGWGKNLSHIRFTHEGIGLRSFIDVKLKGSFWMTGGYEMNYREAFKSFAELKEQSAWQQSGLIGVSKIIDLRSKVLKKTKLQLLWDFLSYRQAPKAPAILFRVGYSFSK